MHRKIVTLLVLMVFTVLSVTGVLAFVLPFDINVIGLHSLLGFTFLIVIGFHIANNWRLLKQYLRSKSTVVCLCFTAVLSTVIFLQPTPVEAILKMSSNTGAALERFEIIDGNAEYSYSPSEDYKLLLKIKQGLEFTENSHIAIWLENQSSYHIRTLYFTDSASAESLPFWSWKRSEYVKAKEEAEQVKKSVDAVTEATPNSSFKAEDYILSEDESYTVLIEINQPGDDQPSLIYAVDIDNSRPSFYQLLTRLGFPEKSSTDEKDEWHINYSTENFSTALKLIDSVMLIIQRKEKNQ